MEWKKGRNGNCFGVGATGYHSLPALILEGVVPQPHIPVVKAVIDPHAYYSLTSIRN